MSKVRGNNKENNKNLLFVLQDNISLPAYPEEGPSEAIKGGKAIMGNTCCVTFLFRVLYVIRLALKKDAETQLSFMIIWFCYCSFLVSTDMHSTARHRHRIRGKEKIYFKSIYYPLHAVTTTACTNSITYICCKITVLILRPAACLMAWSMTMGCYLTAVNC